MTTIKINHHHYDIDAILFDKDGTLLNFGDLWLSWLSKLIDTVNARLEGGFSLKSAAIAQSVGVSPDFKRWDPTGPLTIGSIDDIVAILALHLYQQGQPWNEATRVVRDSLATIDALPGDTFEVTAVPGLATFLATAQREGITMAVVTSDETASALHHLDALGITGFFRAIIGHEQVARGKPYPDMALAACQQLEVAANRTLLFGDSNGDMNMAREAGLLSCIGLAPAAHLGADHLHSADQIIRDYDEVEILG